MGYNARTATAVTAYRTWPATVPDALRAAAEGPRDRGFTFTRVRGRDERFYAWAEVLEAARGHSAAFYAAGLRPGDRLAIVVPESEPFVLAFLGAILGGIIPVPLAPPFTLGKIDTYVRGIEHVVASSRARAILVTSKLRAVLGSLAHPSLGRELLVVESLDLAAPRQNTEPSATPEQVCFLQYTSGSTSLPKGVRVTHANLAAQTFGILHELLHSAPEPIQAVSWLPLYHDMGLIGFVIAPIFAAQSSVFLSPLRFVKDPTTWLDALHRHRAAITFAPNFACALTVRHLQGVDTSRWDLSSLQVLGCGAEPIQPAVIRALLDRLAPARLQPSAFAACYGLAEATLAVCFNRGGLHTDTIDAEALRRGKAVPVKAGNGQTLEVVSCGHPFKDHEVTVLGAGGLRLPERAVGEIAVSGPCVTRGYEGLPEQSAQAFRDRFVFTGDLGYLAGGKLYVCGRSKDLIIVNGRNYHPADVEWVVQEIAGVRKGCVAAFPISQGHASEQLAVAAEWSAHSPPSQEERAAIEARVASTVCDHLGIVPAAVLLVPRGAIPKTSSGKVQRASAKAQFERGTLGSTEAVPASLAGRLALARQMLRSYTVLAARSIRAHLQHIRHRTEE